MAAPAAVSHTGSTTSPEYIAFQANYEVLIKTVGAEPDRICDALFAKGYISPGVRDYVRAVGITNTDKARRLVDAVIAQIRHNPDIFHGFINMPINQTDFTNSAIQKLKESFETELKKQKDPPTLSSQEDMKILNELSSHLRSYGLDDCDYWLPLLKELGVRSKASLSQIEGKLEKFSKLEMKVRNHAEKNAVKKLLKMDKLIKKRKKERALKMHELQASALEENKTKVQSAPKLKNAVQEVEETKQKYTLSNALRTVPLTGKSSPEHFSDVSFSKNSDALALLERLGLRKYYPKRLHLVDALCIKLEPLKLSLDRASPTDPQKLPDLVLHKLMSYDSLCRSDLMAVVEEDDEIYSDQESDSDNELSQSKRNNGDAGGIHPVDCLLSLIICSDDFLRQDLFSRLAKCQLAVPFILPDPFTKQLTIPLWCLRSIVQEWECSNEKGEIVKKPHPIINYGMPVVVFIRIGKHHEVRSKSAILNAVINDSDHFFHRDCEGGSYNLVLGDGLVDMCWYLPGKTTPTFPDAVAFLNLHGDAREHPEQMRFLSQISSMCFVLLTEEGLELDHVTTESLERFGSSAGGITTIGSTKGIPLSLNKKALIDLKKKNVSGIRDAIRSRINRKLDRFQSFCSLEDCCDIREGIIVVDEHSESYRQGLAHATELLTLITSHHNAEPNKGNGKLSLFLPLQGDTLWRAWAANDKELMRQIHRGNKPVNEYSEEIMCKKVAIRKKQLEHVESLTPVMGLFIVSLLRLRGPSNRIFRNYFLQCLKLELNSLSRESISDMQYQYQSVRKELSELQEETVSHDNKLSLLKKKLEDIQEDILSSSLGLEHFLRELGQVYEAAASEPQLYGDSLSCLPKAAAELLIDGYPLELMDGDAAHVPLQWVTAVLDETTKMLGDPNVFVLSVLGLQSTGKSTLLNTVFGLQFKVSAGRCTHGAFMQLLPLDDGLRMQTKFSYVLVVDTEGLRAPQLDPLKTQKHDNELATFVIGLSNITTINTYGEILGDMGNILQTSIHAFLQMTQVKLSPSCQFVHQNAGASVSSEVGRAMLIKKLNQFALEAAIQENCMEKFKCFNDIIKFNDQIDIHYFPGLWKDDPPMAPVNQGYSHSAQKLKLHLIETLHQASATGDMDLHLSAFQAKVQDLWKALLMGNFVFRFQEITAYNSLETEYGKWDWEFRKAMLQWELVAEYEISAAEAASDVAKEKCQQLPRYMATLHEPIEEKMRAFFSGKQSEILVQWEAKFERRLFNLKEELREHAERHCMKLAQSREVISKFVQERKNYAAIITSQVQDYVTTIKKEQDEFSESLKKGRLTAHYLEKILQRKLFAPESLQVYKEQGLITEDQVRAVQAIVDKCSGNLTTTDLEKILFGGILGLEQVKKILTKRRRTEEELEMKFSEIWNNLIQLLPLVSDQPVSVDSEVERILTKFVREKGYEGQLITIIQEKTLREWGTRLELTPVESTHYAIPTPKKIKHFFYGSGETLAAPQKMTERVFDKARECLKAITEKKTDFKSGFTQILLHEVDTAITEESEAIKDQLTITYEYRLTVFLVVCGYAIPKFEEMARSFMERTDPRFYLEKHVRMPLFTRFKNQYYQAIAEEAIAISLCALLEAPIKDQIKQTIGAIMVRRMQASEHGFTSKMALKVKILADLYKEDNYQSYMVYVRNVKGCLQQRIKQYTVQYADERVAADETRLQIMAKEEVSRLIAVIESAVTEVNETEIHEWLTTFSKNQRLVSEIGYINVDYLLVGFDALHEMNLENFKHQIRIGLRELKNSLHATYNTIKCEEDMTRWKDKPYKLLADLIGCTEQCPLCGEQCDFLDPDHYTSHRVKHHTAVHRPSCLAGLKEKYTQVMTSDCCTSSVESRKEFLDVRRGVYHPYRQYDTIYPEWSILPDLAEDSLYWKWFVGKYANKLAETYGGKPAEVPRSWLAIQWPEVARSLEEVYRIQVPR